MDLTSSWDGRGDHRQVSKQIVAGCFKDRSAWVGEFLQLVEKVFIENVTFGPRPNRSQGVGHEEMWGAVCQAGGGELWYPQGTSGRPVWPEAAIEGLVGHGEHLE